MAELTHKNLKSHHGHRATPHLLSHGENPIHGWTKPLPGTQRPQRWPKLPEMLRCSAFCSNALASLGSCAWRICTCSQRRQGQTGKGQEFDLCIYIYISCMYRYISCLYIYMYHVYIYISCLYIYIMSIYIYDMLVYENVQYIWSRPPSLHPPLPPHGLGPQVAAPIPFHLQAIGCISEVQLRIC